MPDGSATPEPLVTAMIRAVTSAYEDAAAAIEQLEDPDEGFKLATELWAALRAATDSNGLLRSRLALGVWKKHELDLAALADRLSTPSHRIRKSRAGQLIQAGREQGDERKDSDNDGLHEDLDRNVPGRGE